MNTPEERACELFEQGYNCAQSVFAAFLDETGMDFETALKLSAPFGGGMAQLREVCGAVSGMFMVMGMKKGFTDPKKQEEKAEFYKVLQEMKAGFEEPYGTIICRDLLKMVSELDGKRPCAVLVRRAAEITSRKLAEI